MLNTRAIREIQDLRCDEIDVCPKERVAVFCTNANLKLRARKTRYNKLTNHQPTTPKKKTNHEPKPRKKVIVLLTLNPLGQRSAQTISDHNDPWSTTTYGKKYHSPVQSHSKNTKQLIQLKKKARRTQPLEVNSRTWIAQIYCPKDLALKVRDKLSTSNKKQMTSVTAIALLTTANFYQI